MFETNSLPVISEVRTAHLIHRRTERDMIARRTTGIIPAAVNFHAPEKLGSRNIQTVN